MKNLDLLNQYLANLAVWNVVGKDFMLIHNFTEEIYDDIFSKFDDVAELVKMKNTMPLSTLSEYLKVASIKEIPGKDFNTTEVLEILKADIGLMKSLAVEIRNLADSEDDFATVAMFEDHAGYLTKQLWFVNSMLK